MEKFANFIYFNIAVYIIYLLIDKVFTFFGLFSNPLLGIDITIMPTDSDINYIIINIIVSTVLSYIVLNKIKQMRNGE